MENKGVLSSKKLFVFIAIVVLLVAILPGQITDTVSLEASLLFFVIAMFSVIGIIRELGYAAVTLNMIHWIFMLVFFFIAPLTQASFGYSAWGFNSMDNDNVIKSCLTIILWIGVYSLSGILVGKRIHLTGVEQREKISSSWLYIFTFISLICGITIIARYGFYNMFSRADMKSGEDAVEMSTATFLVWSKISRATITFTEIVLIMTAIKKEIEVKKLLVVNTVVLLLSSFPLTLSRNEAAAIYLGLFVVLFYRDLGKFRKSPFYILCFLGAILVIFPLLNVFRKMSFYDENLLPAIYRVFASLGDEYLTANYDSFSMIEGVRNYVKIVDVTYGHQLLGAIFFFVPRSIWASKPIGTGAMIAQFQGQLFTNISCPLVAEGYVNFGIFGVVLFAFFYGVLTTILDREYWENAPNNQSFSLIKIVYPCLLPYYFFMLRGGLLSSLAYTLSYAVVFWFLYRISKLRVVIKI